METKYRRLYAEDGHLAYEGQTVYGKPCGPGTAYFPNGNISLQGLFGMKGLLSGREYDEDGTLRFEGTLRINTAYGPNYPVMGRFYSPDGKLLLDGRPKLRCGGVGYRMIEEPGEFGHMLSSCPDCKNLSWEEWGKLKEELNLNDIEGKESEEAFYQALKDCLAGDRYAICCRNAESREQ